MDRTRGQLLDRDGRLPELACKLGVLATVDLGRHENVPLDARQLPQNGIRLLSGCDVMFGTQLGRPRVDLVLEEIGLPTATVAAQGVDEQPSRDLEEPWSEGTSRVIALARAMDPEEELLVEIGGAIRRSGPPEKVTIRPLLVAREELVEGSAVAACVAIHEGLVRVLACSS